ncbi:hypothetical protein [Actinospica robiniae]|uniref:hypothetical protein n=1 Tax=Actinospica robiniae TaxID=304901 RepID=UPI000420AA12|nr:hypothetical protein [Actinospica robiniae]
MTVDIDYGPPEGSSAQRLPREGYPQATKRVVWSVLAAAPVGWKSVRLEYRGVGRYHESEAEVEMLDGSRVPWELPAPLKMAISNLRLSQSSPSGTWHRLSLTVEFPMTVPEVEFDWYGVPEFHGLCPAAEYRRELFHRYRAPEWIPAWLPARAVLSDSALSEYTWIPGESVVPVLDLEPPVQVSMPVPDGLRAALLPLLPEGWDSVSGEVLVIGTVREYRLLATDGEGTRHTLEVTPELIEAFAAHRSEDYTRERGAWLGLTLDLHSDGASSMLLDYSTRPMLHDAPPVDVYAEELWHFPRADEAIPEWLHWRAGLEPAAQKRPSIPRAELRLKRTKETATVWGERKYHKPIPAEEIVRVAAYLRSAPALLTTVARGKDRLFRDRQDPVPLGFRTDGVWIWPEDVAYHLEQDQACPDPPLLKHIREQDFTVPEVPAEMLKRAYIELTDSIEGSTWR